MKMLILMLLTFSTIGAVAQKSVFKSPKDNMTYTYNEAYLWEAYALNGNIVFGVSPTKEEAIKTIEQFRINNEGHPIEPFHKIIHKTVVDDPDYFKTFKDYCPSGYRILKLIDNSALRIIKYNGLRNAAIFYAQKSEKNYGESMEYLSNLYNNFKPYRFKDTDHVSNEVPLNTSDK